VFETLEDEEEENLEPLRHKPPNSPSFHS